MKFRMGEGKRTPDRVKVSKITLDNEDSFAQKNRAVQS